MYLEDETRRRGATTTTTSVRDRWLNSRCEQDSCSYEQEHIVYGKEVLQCFAECGLRCGAAVRRWHPRPRKSYASAYAACGAARRKARDAQTCERSRARAYLGESLSEAIITAEKALPPLVQRTVPLNNNIGTSVISYFLPLILAHIISGLIALTSQLDTDTFSLSIICLCFIQKALILRRLLGERNHRECLQQLIKTNKSIIRKSYWTIFLIYIEV